MDTPRLRRSSADAPEIDGVVRIGAARGLARRPIHARTSVTGATTDCTPGESRFGL